MNVALEVQTKGQRAREAARILAGLGTSKKNEALLAMARALEEEQEAILAANARDMVAGKEKGLSRALLDRLLLNEKRIRDMAAGLRELAALPDPVGEVTSMWTRPNGLQIGRVRVPLGVIGIIYEARPNVTVDAAGLCLKTGNAVILRGGSEAFYSNQALTRVISRAATAAGAPEGAIQLIETTDREAVNLLLRANDYLDVLIPRGGAGLIRTVVENATVPVIETGVGNCHVYVDAEADLDMAQRIVINAKTQRPGVCNAMETLLVHEKVADSFLPSLAAALKEKGVTIRGCERTRAIIPWAEVATETDWATEYLDLILAIRVVDSLESALEHIHRYGTKHSEAIVTTNYQTAREFLARVDAAAVYVNASTRFTDGYEFGFGAEIGISTQKLHARGPMGPEQLTTFKYIIFGSGQIRQ
ncbi:gamma-glutamyl phosphate reductase [Moorella thermoacetica]|uniref:Gamma-glutamyl phosphate reductase n=1 Tax=Moorella thermoacetica (strain ATCC 39073 / JCM 9320) TaxID=264732 RepID=PROA_MOOTA|nr:glutamate-5-semialdehyde dehydrogenase [Moorella thermoacetica]Q2RKZ6.1 RecName: Full=Gamma-glutamyl phosphate reductase; Short=GPR; AltName: Full=Glutamate-5-semialdehyde dehydrogenase; AltName: Full=Glutamyl-gamma-semialdehyde dehydrogenase; Short=GSA dehydrogenase [Moorella thermoacetica ATCC 39073]GLI17301.1 gamma-glutamyl phosphate reductase [Moorella thermoacetica]